MTPNQDQVLGILRIILPVLLAWFVGKGWIASSAVGDVTAALVTLISVAWSAYDHTHANTVAKMGTIPGVDVTNNGAVIEIMDPKLAKAAKFGATK